MDEYLPLREVVFEALRDAIVHGEFEPGERLLEVALAKRLGVSRTPVREAIRMLELEGLVVMVPRKGAEVARITEKDLRDALEIRLSLEELAVELACKRIDEDGRLRLREACENFREAVRSGRVPDIVVASYCGDKEEFLGMYHTYADPVAVINGDCGNKLNWDRK